MHEQIILSIRAKVNENDFETALKLCRRYRETLSSDPKKDKEWETKIAAVRELSGDCLYGTSNYEEALIDYEFAFNAMSALQGETAPPVLAVLFKVEKTLGHLCQLAQVDTLKLKAYKHDSQSSGLRARFTAQDLRD